MAAVTPKNINRQLDQQILGSMVEPLTLSVSRLLGSQRSPIILPPKEDGMAPGEGWYITEIKRLEGWLATDFAGGGLYNIKVVDSNNVSFEWQPYFDPKQYPPKMPFTMQAVANGQPPPFVPTSAPPTDWPPPSPLLATPIPQVPSSMSVPTYQFPFYAPQPRNNADDDRRRLEDEKRVLSERLAQSERDKLAAEHRADLERIRQENDRKLDELKASLAPKTDEALSRRLDKMDLMFEKLVEKLASPTQTGPSPELLAMQKQIEDQRRQMEEERADRRHAESLAAIQKANADQLAIVQRQLDAISQRPSGPDPMMVMVVDAMKDAARQNQGMLDSMKSQMMTPAEVLAFTKASGDGVADLKTNVVRMFTDVFELQKRAFETAAQMLPQGESPVVRVIEQAIEGGKDVFEKIASNKDAAQIAQAKAATAQAKAQEAMINAQRSSMEEMSRREAEQRAVNATRPTPVAPPVTPPVQVAQPAAAPTNGLNGASITDQPDTEGGRVLPFVKPAAGDPSMARLGKTDVQWFGAGALAHVERLRGSVVEWIAAASTVPPTATLEGPGVSPPMAANYVLQSANAILEAGLKVPAFEELYLTDKLEDFAMILLPDVPHQYRQLMIENLKAMQGDNEDDDEGDEDDDDEDDDADEGDGKGSDADDDDEDGEPVETAAAPKVTVAVKGKAPPRQPRA